MPAAPVPPELQSFLAQPRGAVVASIKRNGGLTTTATWYDWRGDHFMLNMTKDGARERNLRRDPNIAMTVLGDTYYDHVSVSGVVVEFRDDPTMADADLLSMRYWNRPYPTRGIPCTTVIARVDRWHSFGNPVAFGLERRDTMD